jgi:leucyl-tRNA synthetase
MHRGLVARYIETSTLLLVPITPHTCDHVWTSLLKKQGSVLTAGWPQSEAPDYVLQRAAQYVEATIARCARPPSTVPACLCRMHKQVEAIQGPDWPARSQLPTLRT